MIVYKDIIQGSEEWERIRCGRPTASRFADFVTAEKGTLSRSKDKTQLSQGARSYIAELIGEAFVPDFKAFIGNAYTDRGTELEPEARKAFIEYLELQEDRVEQVGFCTMDEGACSPGCSPDALIKTPIPQCAKEECECDDIFYGEKCGHCDWVPYIAGLEIKCPAPKTHIKYIMEGELPEEYKRQVHGGMAVTGLKQWHFFSYFPGLQPFHYVARWDEYTENLKTALGEFVNEYAAIWEKYVPKIKLNSK